MPSLIQNLNKFSRLAFRGYISYLNYRFVRFVRSCLRFEATNRDCFYADNEKDYSALISPQKIPIFQPDKKWGHLEKNKWIVEQLKSNGMYHLHEIQLLTAAQTSPNKVNKKAIILHLFYPGLLAEILSILDSNCDFYISIPDWLSAVHYREIKSRLPNAYISVCENKGRDFAPFLQLFTMIQHLDYQWICKIHSKKSSRSVDGDLWRKDTLASLFHSSTLQSLDDTSSVEPAVGLIGPRYSQLPQDLFLFKNLNHLQNLHRVLLISNPAKYFTAGSMFWFKPPALRGLTEIKDQIVFEPENKQIDGTMAHALERVMNTIVEKNGFFCLEAKH